MSINEVDFGVPSYETLRALSGLEFLQRIRDGRLPQAPIAETLNFRMIEAEQGLAVFQGTPSLALYNPMGSVHGGWYGTLLDSCMSCAVQTTLEQGSGYTTVEYGINLVRAIVEGTGPVCAEGRIIHRGRRSMATADGRISDRHGKLLAHGTTTCMIMPLPEAASVG